MDETHLAITVMNSEPQNKRKRKLSRDKISTTHSLIGPCTKEDRNSISSRSDDFNHEEPHNQQKRVKIKSHDASERERHTIVGLRAWGRDNISL